MAHEVDEASARKRIIGWENGRPVYADAPSTADEDDDTGREEETDTKTVGHDDNDASST